MVDSRLPADQYHLKVALGTRRTHIGADVAHSRHRVKCRLSKKHVRVVLGLQLHAECDT